MKKILLFAVLLLMNTGYALSEIKDICIDGIYYEYNTDTKRAKVIKNDSYSSLTSVNIPHSIGWGGMGQPVMYGVYEIASDAFQDCMNLTSVTIGELIEEFGNAFKGCKNLSSVSVGSSSSTFSSENGVLYNKDKTEIALFPPAKTGNLTLPNTVRKILISTFSDGCSLTTLTIPSSLDSIQEISLYGPFEHFTNLTAINVDPENPKYCSEDGVLFDKAKKHLIYYPLGKSGAYTIPATVTSLGEFVFYNCTGLTSIDIPSGITKLPNGAFAGCTGLQSITCRKTDAPLLLATCVFGINSSLFPYPPVDKSTCVVYVPSSLLPAYKSATEWKDFAHIFGVFPFHYVGYEDQELGEESLVLHLPDAPEIEGFTFLRWEPVAADVLSVSGITIKAIYESNTPSDTPEVYTNPANPAQKLIREGNVYVLYNDKLYNMNGGVVR